MKDNDSILLALSLLKNNEKYRLEKITDELPYNKPYINMYEEVNGDDHKIYITYCNTAGHAEWSDTITRDKVTNKIPDGFPFDAIQGKYAVLKKLDLTPKEIQFHKSYSEIARVWSKNSYCTRRQVGAIIVKDRRIISDGFNGTPSGRPNVCEIDGKTKSEVLHAEANAITKLAQSTISSTGSTMYVTCSPCMECAKLIVQSGIKNVFFSELYHSCEGLLLLLDCGVNLYYWSPE